uniref:Uncharacterized protein n=1 Tax=Rhizophora mucronata TaxID=61149 RepID=A0A2P2QJ42_RHIMU
MVPVMLFPLKSKTWSCFSRPISGKMVPFNLLSLKHIEGGKLETWLYGKALAL